MLQIERPATVTDETFDEAAASPEFLNERREAMFRIFDANNDHVISWQEVLQTLVTFADTSDPRRKFDLQFETWDVNEDGLLTYEEIHKSMTHTFLVSANMLRIQFPKQMARHNINIGMRRRNNAGNLMSDWTEEDRKRFSDSCDAVLKQANLGGEFTDALYGNMGKAKTDAISKEEFIKFMVERGDAILQLRAGISVKILSLVQQAGMDNRNQKMESYFSHGVGKFQKDLTTGILSRAMPAMPNMTVQNQYSRGVGPQYPAIAGMPGMPGMPGAPGALPTPTFNHPLFPAGLMDARMQAMAQERRMAVGMNPMF